MVAAWWGPNVVMAHPKLKNLPLGPKWNWRIAVHHSEDENKSRLLAVFSKWARDPAANFRLPKDNLLFVKMGEATWEALLAGSIPILESSVRDSMYEGLPVLIVKSWTDLSLPLLQSAYTNLTAAGKSYRWEKLFAPYYLQQLSADLLQSYMSAGS
ncbi:hypothetical protein OEZ85_000029 [Tetradesmus obliquus]|uniref:Exostosin GT47 domain-containing protein n=1 Tax=Tetradesmus obliquus TaxID=3088 RepID=A0ABY8URF9_TETOB|nr:hypothetical protein OEZ85_000029 [Tetradesmus obliquus]